MESKNCGGGRRRAALACAKNASSKQTETLLSTSKDVSFIFFPNSRLPQLWKQGTGFHNRRNNLIASAQGPKRNIHGPSMNPGVQFYYSVTFRKSGFCWPNILAAGSALPERAHHKAKMEPDVGPLP